MKVVWQRRLDEFGDCHSACIASLLECSLDAVPNFHFGPSFDVSQYPKEKRGRLFWSNFWEWCNDYGFTCDDYTIDEFFSKGLNFIPRFVLCAVVGGFGDTYHCVIGRTNTLGMLEFVHCPVPKELATTHRVMTYEEGVEWLQKDTRFVLILKEQRD